MPAISLFFNPLRLLQSGLLAILLLAPFVPSAPLLAGDTSQAYECVDNLTLKLRLYPEDSRWQTENVFEGVVTITRTSSDGATDSTDFDITKRGMEDFRQEQKLPKDFFNIEQMRGGRVLDAGAGSGTLVQELLDLRIDAYGIDPVRTPLNERLGKKMIKGDMSKLPFENGFFRVIYSNNSIFSYFRFMGQHRELLVQSIQEFKRTLERGGLVKMNDVFIVDEMIANLNAIGGFRVLYSPSQSGTRGPIVFQKI